MRAFHVLGFACTVVLIIGVIGCAHPQSKTPSVTAPVPPSPALKEGQLDGRIDKPHLKPSDTASDAEVERRAKALASFSAGLLAQDRDASEEALRYFAQSVAADPSHEALAMDVARRYWSHLQTNRAIEVLRRTSALPEASSEVKGYLGSLYLQAHRFPEATAAFRASVEKDPQNLASYQALVPLLLKEKHYAEARHLLDKAGSQSVRDPAYWIDLGSLYSLFDASDPKTKSATRERGLACLHRAEAMKPTDPMLLQRLGERYQALNDSVRAETIFRQLRTTYPNSPAPTAKLAELYLRQGKIKEAKEQLEALRRNNPADAIPYYYLGLVAMEERDFSQATAHFDRSIFLNPEFEGAYSELAASQLSQHQETAALATLELEQKKFGSSYRQEFLSALACARLKDFAAAEAHFVAAETAARTRQPDALDHRFYYQWGAVLEEAGQREESEKRIRQSLSIKPDFDQALNHLAYTWVEQGIRLAEARKMIEQALRSDPDNPAYLDSLAWLLFKMGKPQEALIPMEKASRLMPEPDATVEDHLGDILNAVGRKGDAKAAWERSVRVEKNEAIQKKIDAAK